MNETTRHTLSVLVENTAGVLSQVSRLFSRKGYNIDSLAVGTTDDPGRSPISCASCFRSIRCRSCPPTIPSAASW